MTKFKKGDLVMRARGGRHGHYKERESFIIDHVDHIGQVVDQFGWKHDQGNIELITPAESIVVNNYQIY